VDDLVLVQVHERGDDLRHVVLHLHFRQSLPALQQFVEGLIGADLHQDLNVFVVLEDVLELDDVLLAEGLVDLDLGDQLHQRAGTFCLARERFSELLAMILAAETRFVSRLVTS
jgi:hypothetical protein